MRHERGNTLLIHTENDGCLAAWVKVEGDLHLEITIDDNYPILGIRLILRTQKQLAAHIRRHYGGGAWKAR